MQKLQSNLENWREYITEHLNYECLLLLLYSNNNKTTLSTGNKPGSQSG